MMAGIKQSKEEQERYQAEQDLRTLVEASRIRADKARRAAAMKSAEEQRKALAGVKDK